MAARKPIEIDYDEFRDHIGTVDEEGKRRWIYPKKPHGKFTKWRSIVAYFLIGLLFLWPFIKYKGEPFFLFNILERKFILFGIPFWPQDFHLLALAMITFFVGIILFTAIWGRVWCGWACPQTLFMEMVFRKIEYWIEGDAPKQRKLDRQSWNREKILKKGSKWLVFFLIAFLIGNLVMSYVIGIDELSKLVTEGPVAHWGKFTFVMIFSGIFFFVFAYLREQACLVICPYGRLQGVLLDKDSMVVHYDHVRGEPRDRFHKGEERTSGDCIACTLCVQVCPTGIDIKDGTQMECINCTACMDVCDEVMDKVGFERGLIRYASYNQIVNKVKFKLTPRIIGYIGVLLVLGSVLTFSLALRSSVEATVLRTKGTMYQLKDDDKTVTNLYNLQVVNKTKDNFSSVEIRVASPEGATVKIIGDNLDIASEGIAKGSFFIEMPRSLVEELKTSVVLEIYDGERMLDRAKTTFLGPPGGGR